MAHYECDNCPYTEEKLSKDGTCPKCGGHRNLFAQIQTNKKMIQKNKQRANKCERYCAFQVCFLLSMI